MSPGEEMSTEQRPWQWNEATWRAHAERVRAGRDLTPRVWPGGARMAVALSFDPDHETISLRDGETSPGAMGRGEFGSRVGARRILRLLDEFRIPATFFIPAVSALLHPGEVKDYAAAGHEIGAHGWIHERNTLLSAKDELELTQRGVDALEHLAGRRSVGRGLVEHMRAHENVWFATHGEVADHVWRSAHQEKEDRTG